MGETMDLERVVALLEKEVAGYRVPVVDLIATQTRDPFRVLTATILSARTRDEVTARAAARLFARAPDVEGLARLQEGEIAALIHPVGFFRSKASYLARLPAALARFGNQVPGEIDSLLTLPGVGRKTANLVKAVAFNQPAICVDTHVHRIMNIWGYVDTKNPLATEMALRKKLPRKYWIRINSLLVAFGQGTCRPVRPHCDRCVISRLCPGIGVSPRRLMSGKRAKEENRMKKLISWNVNGIRALEKKGFIDLLAELDPDILGLQETRAQPGQLADSLKNIPGYTSYWASAAKKGYSGVAVYTRIEPLSVIVGLGIPEYDREGRVLTLEFADFFLINAYFPNARPGLKRIDYKLAFNRELKTFADRLGEKKAVLICGDFNVAHRPIDLANPEANEENPGYSAQERAWMDDFLEHGYCDTFRKFNREPGQYTWWSFRFNARARNIGWRIDYFCVDRAGADRVKGAAILNGIMGSDHCPISLDFV
ncbi:MAG: exodeoxyribonuclease III [Desulfobacterales bacterium]|nr:exodeoxyribonuclease III [Desulfobacterales bacterium]